MSIDEYAIYTEDFFQFEESFCENENICFPCIVCRFKDTKKDEKPCRYCGHNSEMVQFFNCSLCSEIVTGDPYVNGKVIGEGTPAKLGYLCIRCFNIIKEEMKKMD